MRVLGWLARSVGLGLVVLVAVALAARLTDGPIGPFASGALRGGALVPNSAIDWSFARDLDTVEFQLLHPARSRTVWVVVRGGELYIPCRLPGFRLWKQWPHEALKDGRAVIRIDGKRYPVQAVRVSDPKLLDEVSAELGNKYLDGIAPEPGSVWLFRMDPRTGRSDKRASLAAERYSPTRPKRGGRRS